jgi:hypothetical protein
MNQMSLLTNISIATNAFFTSVRNSNIRRTSVGLIALAAALPLVAGLAGCGGGGGAGAPDPSKEVPSSPSSPSPTATPTPTPDPSALGFVPNYSAELIASRRWDKSVLKVGFTAPVDSTGAARNVRPLVQQAIDMWNGKVGQDITFQLADDTDDADVKIAWVPTGTLSSDAIGRTEVRFRNADQVLISANVSVEQSLPDSFQVQVICHELGHSLGIEGHSTLSTDLMYANAHLPAQITTRDQNTILKAYSSSRSAQPGVSNDSVSTATSAVQYVCGSNELTNHATHSH